MDISFVLTVDNIVCYADNPYYIWGKKWILSLFNGQILAFWKEQQGIRTGLWGEAINAALLILGFEFEPYWAKERSAL